MSSWVMHWVAIVARHALLVTVIAGLMAAGMVFYTADHLTLDTDTAHMFSAKLPWQIADANLDRLFPKQSNTIAVVIDGATPEIAAIAQQKLTARLEADRSLFPSVFALQAMPFFRQNGLLYLDVSSLRKLSSSLVAAQPFLGALAQDPSLHGLFNLLTRAVGQMQVQHIDLRPAMHEIAAGVAAADDDRPFDMSWQKLMQMPGAEPDATRRFIEIDPRLYYNKLMPAGAAIAAVRDDIATLHLTERNGVKVRLTGGLVMQQEELISAGSGAAIAFAVGLVLVVLLLFLGLRSWRLVFSALVTLTYGLMVTTFFAAVVVGHLNLISVAFGVLYVGLGIDYALYLCMQYRERLGHSETHEQALPHAAKDIGGFMVVCALTTSIGFLAFTPTKFTGIAELGLISGAGMFISLAVSLTLLPALIRLLPPDGNKVRLSTVERGFVGWMLALPYRYGRALWIGAGIAAVGAAFLVPYARFDFNPLDMRNPHSEAVSTFRELLKDPNVPTLTLSVITPNASGAKAVVDKLSKLPLVRRAMTVEDFIPDHQAEKLKIIHDLSFALGPLIESPPARLKQDETADISSLRVLEKKLYEVKGTQPGADAMHTLGAQLARFYDAWSGLDAAGRHATLARLRHDLLGSLPAHLQDLADSLKARLITFKDLPETLVSRWISKGGKYRVEIWPEKILDNNSAIAHFVDQVRAVVPQASGPPVEYLESGRVVVKSFKHAFAYSLVAITVLLLILLRNVVDTLLVLVPLALAGILTVAGTVIVGMPFNFTNVIALPLVLGVGVDYGVFMVQRGRVAGRSNLLLTGSARAVLFGALITIANFSNLALSEDPGTRSMGLLLAIGLVMTLICALILLPSLMARRYRFVSRSS